MEFLEIVITIIIIVFAYLTMTVYREWTNSIKRRQNEEQKKQIEEQPKKTEIIEICPKNLVNSNTISEEVCPKNLVNSNTVSEEVCSKNLVNSNTISEEVFEKEIQSKLSNIKDINQAAEVFKEEDVIAVDRNETNSFLISHVMAQTTPKQKEASETLKQDLNKSIQTKIQEKGGINQFVNNIVKFKQESVEFTMVALNECFKQNSDKQILFQKEGFNDEVHKYYLNNLICSGENKKDKVTVFFEDNKKYSFDQMKSDTNKSKEFIDGIEEVFYSKFPKSQGYNIEISTIVKGSKGVVFSSNLSDKQLNDFLDEVNKHKEFGAKSSHSKEPALNDLKISADMFDTRGNIDFTNLGGHEKRGGLDYYQPKGWKRIGLKVSKLYDGGNDDWLAMNGNANEWAVAFHGTKINFVSAISKTNIVAGAGQACNNHTNRNHLNNSKYSQCGVGVYFGQCIELSDTTGYCPVFNVNGANMKVAFQCRVNPREVRITTDYTKNGCGKTIVVPNSSPGCYDNIRPYGILIKLA
jgi:hypothetical protein